MNIAGKILRYGIGKMPLQKSVAGVDGKQCCKSGGQIIVFQVRFLVRTFFYRKGMWNLFSKLVTEEQAAHLPDGQDLYGENQYQENSTDLFLHV